MKPRAPSYHPKWYRRRMPIFWWMRSPSYIRFIARELTSLAVAYAAVLLLVQARAVWQGAAAYERFLAWLASPGVVAFHTVITLALIFHAVTWLGLAPKAMVVKLGRRRVPDVAILVGHYAALGIASAIVVWTLVLR